MLQQQQQPAQPPAAAEDKQKLVDLLKQLGDLKAAGLLTEEEFNQKKADILSRL